jgi:hypothetical protein
LVLPSSCLPTKPTASLKATVFSFKSSTHLTTPFMRFVATSCSEIVNSHSNPSCGSVPTVQSQHARGFSACYMLISRQICRDIRSAQVVRRRSRNQASRHTSFKHWVVGPLTHSKYIFAPTQLFSQPFFFTPRDSTFHNVSLARTISSFTIYFVHHPSYSHN